MADQKDKVILQLKWHHQFQFAGYYAAIHKGFYREAGFDVIAKEGGPEIPIVDEVITGKAHFGIMSSDLLVDRNMG